MLTAGKDQTKSRLLITGPRTIYFTLKNDASPWQHDHCCSPTPIRWHILHAHIPTWHWRAIHLTNLQCTTWQWYRGYTCSRMATMAPRKQCTSSSTRAHSVPTWSRTQRPLADDTTLPNAGTATPVGPVKQHLSLKGRRLRFVTQINVFSMLKCTLKH